MLPCGHDACRWGMPCSSGPGFGSSCDDSTTRHPTTHSCVSQRQAMRYDLRLQALGDIGGRDEDSSMPDFQIGSVKASLSTYRFVPARLLESRLGPLEKS